MLFDACLLYRLSPEVAISLASWMHIQAPCLYNWGRGLLC